jgi:hypothetical protein
MAKKQPDRVRLSPFVGWKGLLAHPDGRLASPSREADWPPREPLVAECDRKVPFARCMCGIYATKTFEDLKGNGYNWSDTTFYRSTPEDLVWVVAEVKLWGEVRKATIGYRAQYAHPAKVYVPGQRWQLGRRIRDLYGCKLGFINRFTGEVI